MVLRIAALALALTSSAGMALDTSQGTVKVDRMIGGLEEPWAIDFLPDGGTVITERDGRLVHATADGQIVRVAGIPAVVNEGQGGLLDILVPRDFAETRELLFTLSAPQNRGSGTALIVGRLNEAGDRLERVRTLFEMAPGSSGGRHFGSRIVEAPDGRIFLTIGDRGDRPSAQDLSVHNGSVIRINRDGSIPTDNPFIGQGGARPEIWSYGHRNPQGAAMDASGQLWLHEHGARGGDEVNRVIGGANYGWPVISYGTHYSGARIGEGTAKPGMQQPAHYWDPSIAPSGMIIYTGELFREWEGDIFAGSLKFGLISRLEVSGQVVREAERITGEETARVRDLAQAPDGSIWWLSVGQGAAYRMTPG
ncbi:MAG: PQQ-dependent sugar dehydrogenase [Pseudomonadota bacterium]